MVITGNFNIYKRRRGLCIYDNGTDICDKGHKLKVLGVCVSQALGRANTLDAAFQPTYPVCDYNYFSEDSSVAHFFSKGGYEALYSILSRLVGDASNVNITVQDLEWLHHNYDILKNIPYFEGMAHMVPKLYGGIMEHVMMHLNDLGVIRRGKGVVSDFFLYDIYGNIPINLEYLFSLLRNNSYIFNRESIYGKFHQVSSYASSVTSSPFYDEHGDLGENPFEICVSDLYPPQVWNIIPDPESRLRHPSFDIQFSLYDYPGGIDLGNLNVTVSGSQTAENSGIIIENGQTVFSGTYLTGSGTFCTINYSPPVPWQYNEDVYLTVTGTDMLPIKDDEVFTCCPTYSGVNSFEYKTNFKVYNTDDLATSITVLPDADAPYTENVWPDKYSTNNSVTDIISFDVVDDVTGVDLYTLRVRINGELIINNGVSLYSAADVTEIADGYRVTYSPGHSFTYGDRIVVYVRAKDKYAISPNELVESWYYDIINTTSVSFEGFLPDFGITKSPELKIISVDISDYIYSIDKDSTFFTINDVPVPTNKTEIYGDRDLLTESGTYSLMGLTVSGASGHSFEMDCVTLSGNIITGGTLVSGTLEYGSVSHFPDPYSSTVSGGIVDLSVVGGDISYAVVGTTLQSGVNWDGKTECGHIVGVDVGSFSASLCEANRVIVNSVVGYRLECDYPDDEEIDFVVGAHTTNGGTLAPVTITMLYPIYQGYSLSTERGRFENNDLVEILVGGLNKTRNYREKFYNYWFRTKEQQHQDLGAYISAVRKDSDLVGTIIPVAPVHRPGEEVTVKIYAEDEENNILDYIFKYTIEG